MYKTTSKTKHPTQTSSFIMKYNNTGEKNCTHQLFSRILSADYSFVMPCSFWSITSTKWQSFVTKLWQITDKQTSSDSLFCPLIYHADLLVLLSATPLKELSELHTQSHQMLFAFQTVAWEEPNGLTQRLSIILRLQIILWVTASICIQWFAGAWWILDYISLWSSTNHPFPATCKYARLFNSGAFSISSRSQDYGEPWPGELI